jgi:hypothetical protein
MIWGESIVVNSYELGSNFDKMDKLEKAVISLSNVLLTCIAH